MGEDLLIKISADASEALAKMAETGEEGEKLEGRLKNAAAISAIAFAALTAEVVSSAKAFSEASTANIALSNALQNQGIYTDKLKDSYKEWAEAVSAQTGVSAVQITQAQTIAQQFLGQVPVTEQLTKAIVDLSVAKKISLTEAAEAASKAIGNGTGQLLRMGLQVNATMSETERYTATINFLNAKFSDSATSIDPLTLATKKLGVAFEQNQEALGARFAPVLASVINAITGLVSPSEDATGIMVDFKASLIAVGLALSATTVGIYALGTGWTAFKAAAIALNIELTATKFLLYGLGIGLVVLAVTELALHFKQISAVVQVFIADMKQLGNVAGGVGKILAGLYIGGVDQIKEGLNDIANAFKKVGSDAKEAWNTANGETKKAVVEQSALKKEFADKEHTLSEQRSADQKAIIKAEKDYVIAENNEESVAVLAIKKKEIETLKAIAEKGHGSERSALQAHYAKLRAEEAAQHAEDAKIQTEFNKEDAAARKKHGNAVVKIKTDSDKKEMAAIKANTDTREKAQKKVYQADLKEQQKAHNQFLQDEIKFGTAYAAINGAMHSAIYEGSKSAFGSLAELQQSSNSTLKEIGKVAAIANIIIHTAESAMNIYTGFSTIPIVGPILGVAGAAAAVVFGAEQVSKVSAAETGGLVGGSGYGDSQPYLLEPNELITPRQNFDEVITSVAKSRGYDTGDGNSETRDVIVTIGFDGRDAQQVLTARRIEDQSLGTYRGRA